MNLFTCDITILFFYSQTCKIAIFVFFIVEENFAKSSDDLGIKSLEQIKKEKDNSNSEFTPRATEGEY